MGNRLRYGKRFGAGAIDSARQAIAHGVHNKNAWGQHARYVAAGKNGKIGSMQENSLREAKAMGKRQPSLPKISILEDDKDV